MPVRVVITRQPFIDYFTLRLENGYTYELEPEDTRAWFKIRNADMDTVERALDHCWNFGYSEVRIHNFREPVLDKRTAEPDI